MPDPRRPVGRPRIDTADTSSTTLSITLSTRQYDDLHHRARRDGISIAEAIRRQLHVDDGADDAD